MVNKQKIAAKELLKRASKPPEPPPIKIDAKVDPSLELASIQTSKNINALAHDTRQKISELVDAQRSLLEAISNQTISVEIPENADIEKLSEMIDKTNELTTIHLAKISADTKDSIKILAVELKDALTAKGDTPVNKVKALKVVRDKQGFIDEIKLTY